MSQEEQCVLETHDGTEIFRGDDFDCHMKAISLNGGHLNRGWTLKYRIRKLKNKGIKNAAIRKV